MMRTVTTMVPLRTVIIRLSCNKLRPLVLLTAFIDLILLTAFIVLILLTAFIVLFLV
jgi:hypothetical protein